MTGTEFNNQFDILYNNISSNQAPGLNGYEKSVFLTMAQEEILKSYFSGKNKYGIAFDGLDRSYSNALRQADFSNLIKVKSLSQYTDILDNTDQDITINPDLGYRPITESIDRDTLIDVTREDQINITKIDERSRIFKLGNITDLFIPIQKWITGTEGAQKTSTAVTYQILPINFISYQELMTSPYPYPTKKQAWELTNSDGIVEIILPKTIFNIKYNIRYVKRPYPIILENLSDYDYSLSINSLKVPQDPVCELDEIIHPIILQRAVELAIASYKGQGTELLTIGSISSTDLGVNAPANNDK